MRRNTSGANCARQEKEMITYLLADSPGKSEAILSPSQSVEGVVENSSGEKTQIDTSLKRETETAE